MAGSGSNLQEMMCQMAVVKPFRAVRYNPRRFEDLRVVVSQPYDRIDAPLQQAYYSLSPYNIVRIIYGRAEPGDRPDDPAGPNIYTRARRYLQEWLDAGILVREERPALYAYEQIFTVNGQTRARLGLIAAVQLADFAEGIILPHEQTHSGPRQDRLALLAATQANTELIFLLYPDSEHRVAGLLSQAIGHRPPDVDVIELAESDVRQHIWTLTDPPLLAAIEAAFAPMRGLIIADGHHRYSTSLTYRAVQRRAHPDAPGNAAFNFVLATLVSMDDPGLVVLPTHREVRGFTATSPADLLDRARPHFAIEPVGDLDGCLARVNAHPAGHAIGFYGGQAVGFHVLTLKDARLADTLIAGPHSPARKSLAVSILHDILLAQIARVPAQGIEDLSLIRYHRDARQAIAGVDDGPGGFAFLLSPTRMDQIRTIALGGETMPQKSTDFYPKVISGLALLPVGPDERL